jgi:hypothetical protein
MPFENVLPPSADTVLSISLLGQLLYQARSLSQTLEVIDAASQLDRTINGKLIDMSAPQFRKYKSTVNIPAEVNPSPLDNIWPGMEVLVACAASLGYQTGRVGSPARPQVSGSSWSEPGGQNFYRPLLDMRIISVKTNFDEWKNIVGWSIDLEEI